MGDIIAMMRKFANSEHPLRYASWVAHPFADVYVLDDLICQPGGRPRFTSPGYRYAWCVWKPQHQGRSSLWWLSRPRFVTPGSHADAAPIAASPIFFP